MCTNCKAKKNRSLLLLMPSQTHVYNREPGTTEKQRVNPRLSSQTHSPLISPLLLLQLPTTKPTAVSWTLTRPRDSFCIVQEEVPQAYILDEFGQGYMSSTTISARYFHLSILPQPTNSYNMTVALAAGGHVLWSEYRTPFKLVRDAIHSHKLKPRD